MMKLLLLAATAAVASADDYECCNDDYSPAGPYENPDRDMEENDRSYDYSHQTDEQIAFMAVFAECMGADSYADDFEAQCNGLNNGGCSIQDFDTPLQHAYFVNHEDPYMQGEADRFKKGAQQHCLANDWVERSSKIAWSYDKYVAKIHVCQNSKTQQECEDACCKFYDGGNDAYDDGTCSHLSHHGLTHDDHDDCGWKGQEQPAADKAAADKAAAAVTTTTKIELSLDMDVNLDELDAKETQALEDGVVDGLVATGACEKEDVKTVTLSQDKTRRARRAENAPVKAEIVFKPDTVDPTEVETAVTTAINSGSFKVEAEINGETISATITEAPVVESATKKKGKKGASSEDQVWTPWCWTGGVDGCGGEAGAGADGAVTTVVSVTQLVVATALAVGVML